MLYQFMCNSALNLTVYKKKLISKVFLVFSVQNVNSGLVDCCSYSQANRYSTSMDRI